MSRPPTTNSYVLAELRAAIASGRLRPGEQVRQDALAERLGVSRVPIREALKILEGEGQVTYAPHRGYFVAELSLADLREVYRIRELLEAEAIGQAVPKMTAADAERLVELHEDAARCAATGDISGMIAANRQFHFTVFECCDMPRLVRLIRLLWDATDAYRSRYYHDTANRERACAEHEAIVTAIAANDAAEAIRLAAAHRDAAVRALADSVL